MHIKTVILLGNFFHLVCVMLLICQQRFLFNVFLRFFCHKKRVFNVFYSWGQRFLHLWCITLHQNVDLGNGFQAFDCCCYTGNSIRLSLNIMTRPLRTA